MKPGDGGGWVRSLFGIAIAGLFLVPLYAAVHAFGAPVVLSWAAAALIVAVLAWQLRRRLPAALEDVARIHRLAPWAWLLFAAVAAVQVGRVSAFVGDIAGREQSVLPSSDFMVHHSCFTAYYEAARLSRGGTLSDTAANVYDPSLYDSPTHPYLLDGVKVDPYEYPPQFLLAPRAALLLTDDFPAQRALWFLFELGCLTLALFAVAGWIGGDLGVRAALLAPAVLLADPTRITLQMGNFQVAAIAIALLAMLALERRRRILGSALLSFVILTKVFPGVLLVYLLARRRWRDVAWTVGFSVLFTLVTVLVIGPGSLRAFLSFQMPRLASGDAFPFLRVAPWTILINHSIFGMVLKLHLFGVAGASFALAARAAWVWTIVALAIAWMAGRIEGDRLDMAQLWLALLGLAALRSPFLPQEYAMIVPVWLLTLVACRVQRPFSLGGVGVVVAWLALNYLLARESFRGVLVAAITTSMPQLVGLALLAGTFIVLYRRRGGLPPQRTT